MLDFLKKILILRSLLKFRYVSIEREPAGIFCYELLFLVGKEQSLVLVDSSNTVTGPQRAERTSLC